MLQSCLHHNCSSSCGAIYGAQTIPNGTVLGQQDLAHKQSQIKICHYKKILSYICNSKQKASVTTVFHNHNKNLYSSPVDQYSYSDCMNHVSFWCSQIFSPYLYCVYLPHIYPNKGDPFFISKCTANIQSQTEINPMQISRIHLNPLIFKGKKIEIQQYIVLQLYQMKRTE